MLTKVYEAADDIGLRYVGLLANGVLSGYWYSSTRPSFNGLFWLARKERLTEATVRALDGRVRSRSWRRVLANAAIVPIIASTAWGFFANKPAFIGAAFMAWAGFVALHWSRARKLGVEVARWKAVLKEFADSPNRAEAKLWIDPN